MAGEQERDGPLPWQGAPGYSGVDPERSDPHAPMPGAPPYPPGTEPRPAATAAPGPGRAAVAQVLPRCVAAPAGWVVVALLVAAVAAPGSWALRAAALVLPWALTAAALLVPARRGTGPGLLVAFAFAPFWLLHAIAVGALGW